MPIINLGDEPRVVAVDNTSSFVLRDEPLARAQDRSRKIRHVSESGLTPLNGAHGAIAGRLTGLVVGLRTAAMVAVSRVTPLKAIPTISRERHHLNRNQKGRGMKLQHNLGGLEGLGDIDYEKNVFVQDWEKRIFGIHAALMGLSDSLREALPSYDLDAAGTTFHTTWTWADLRKGAEAMNPFDYFKYSYYEKWLGGISGYCIENGYLTEDELTAAIARARDLTDVAAAAADHTIDQQVIRYLREGDSPRRGPATPRFSVGDTVLIANPPTGEHTRLPGYLRGHHGTVTSVADGNYAYFCSTGADGLGDPVPVYIVRFDPIDLWGETAEANPSPLYAELYEPYLTAASQKETPAS